MALTVSECHFALLGAQAQAPGVDRLAHAFGKTVMPGEDVFQAFLGDQVERDAQAAQKLRCGRVWEIARIVGPDHVVEGEIAAVMPRRLRRGQRALADGQEAKAGRQHEALLRSADGAIDAPFFLAEVDGADRGNAVDEKQCGMPRRVKGCAHRCDVAGDAGRGLIVRAEHRLDAMLLVGRRACSA